MIFNREANKIKRKYKKKKKKKILTQQPHPKIKAHPITHKMQLNNKKQTHLAQ